MLLLLTGTLNQKKWISFWKTENLSLVFFLKRYSDSMIFFSDCNTLFQRYGPQVLYLRTIWYIFQPLALKIFPWKNLLYIFLKNLLASKLKNLLYFLKKSFSYISGNGTFLCFLKKKKFFLVFPKIELFLFFSKKSLSYILGNQTFQT